MKTIILNFRRNWITKLSISLLTLMLCNIDTAVLQEGSVAQAQNNRPIFRSASGDTTFPAAAQASCAGQIVWYSTRYRGIRYEGNLWVQSPSGSDCEGGRGRMLRGYFEERGADDEWCKGQLMLYLTNDPRGGSYVQWNEIAAVPGYSCAGAGTTPTLPLRYIRQS